MISPVPCWFRPQPTKVTLGLKGQTLIPKVSKGHRSVDQGHENILRSQGVEGAVPFDLNHRVRVG